MGIIVDPATLERGLRSEFVIAAQTKTDPMLDSLMMRVASTKDSEKYGWLGQVNSMKEWTDNKVFESVTEHTFTIQNVKYENTLAVRRTDILDDQVGATPARIRDLTIKGKFHPQKLLIDAIIAGASTVCYDGQYFFDTDHSEGASGTQANVAASLGSGTTLAGIQADFRRARAAIMGFKDSKGNPIWETPIGVNWVVAAPVGLWGVFEELQNAAVLSNTTNVLKGVFDLVSLPRLTANDADNWYLFAVTPEMKPFILQERDPLQFSALEGDSDMGFLRDIYAYSVTWRGAVGYGWWQCAFKTTN